MTAKLRSFHNKTNKWFQILMALESHLQCTLCFQVCLMAVQSETKMTTTLSMKGITVYSFLLFLLLISSSTSSSSTTFSMTFIGGKILTRRK